MNIFLLLTVFLLGLLLGMQFKKHAKKALSEAEHEYYLKLEETLSSLSALRHDMRNHLSVLDYHLSRNDAAGARHYLSRVQQLEPDYGQVITSPNRTLSAILGSKKYLCAAQQIQLLMQMDFPGFHKLTPEDITILFGNVLDNAIHAVSSLPIENRIIQLSILQADSYLTIACTNPYTQDSTFPTVRPGQGLRNIHTLVERFSGTVQIRQEEGQFTILILLPNHP